MDTVIDHTGAPSEHTRWRTLAVFAHTLSCSARVVALAATGKATPERVDAVVDRWWAHVFRVSKTTLTVEGLQHIHPGEPYLLLSNHTSLMDIPAVCATFPGSVRFVAKAELRKVPVFGLAMDQAGIIFVDRSDRAAAIAALSGANSLTETGTSLWIAAEGGRSRDGTLGPFKKGPFHVALQLGVPVIPTWVEGADGIIAAGSLQSVTGGRVHVVYGPPIETAGLTREDIPDLMARCREWMRATRESQQTAHR